MKTQIMLAMCLAIASTSLAQAPASQPAAPPAPQKTLAATLNVYVFPTKGQTAAQQSTDEAECYQWAVQSTGSDPFELQKQAQQAQQQTAQQKQQVQQSGQGAGVKGAVGGAAVGAVIGEMSDGNASKGAAYGAPAGAVIARRRTNAAKAEATQQVEQQGQQVQQATAEQIANFKKAFSVCLEAKAYMVKF